jgi:hypothetical protein
LCCPSVSLPLRQILIAYLFSVFLHPFHLEFVSLKWCLNGVPDYGLRKMCFWICVNELAVGGLQITMDADLYNNILSSAARKPRHSKTPTFPGNILPANWPQLEDASFAFKITGEQGELLAR